MAMSLVASSWMTLGNAFQGMTLRIGQLQEKRAELRKESDRYELAILATMQLSDLNQSSRK